MVGKMQNLPQIIINIIVFLKLNLIPQYLDEMIL